MNRFRFIAAAILGLAFACIARAEDAATEWPRGWKVRVAVQAAAPADCYDVTVQHDGLARADARDVRVVGPDGQPVSLFVSYADSFRFRVLFDGNSGTGTYRVYFGNLIDKLLPPVPGGVSQFGAESPKGRKDWMPQGGFACISFDPIEKIDRLDMVSLEQVTKAYDTIRVRVDAAEKKEAAAQPIASKRRKFELKTVHRSSNVDIGNVDAVELLRDEKTPASRVPQNWFHIFRAQIDVPAAKPYQFMLGEGRPGESLGVLFADGNYAKPVINGWHSNSATMPGMVFDTVGKTDLSPGKHILELYTTRRNPELRWNVLGGTAVPEYLSGLDANYDNCTALKHGEMEVGTGTLADVYLSAIRHWAANDRFSLARSLARVAQARFAGSPEKRKEFAMAFEEAEQHAYETNWLTEGKLPSRTGAVANAVAKTWEPKFSPPLRAGNVTQENYPHDQRHLSSSLWIEGKLVYGLPFDIQDNPWGITSGVCAADDVLYAGTKNGVMHAINLSSATERWSFPAGGSCLGCPLLYREILYFGTLDRRLYALDVNTGRMLWNFPTRGWIEGGACAVAGKNGSGSRVYFGSRDMNLYAMDAALGLERWHTALNGEITATPATDAGNGADGGHVYVGTLAGDFFAVDARTGTVAWKFPSGAAIQGGACIFNQRVVFGNDAGKVFCLDASNGKAVWHEPVDTGGPVIAAPIFVNAVLYGGTSDGKLWGIDADDGVIGWHIDMPQNGAIGRQPLFADDNLIFTSRGRDAIHTDGKPVQMRGANAVFHPAPGVQAKIEQAHEPMVADGQLSEPAWKKATPLGPFYKHNGMSYGDPVSARILWEPQQLFVAVECKNIAPASGNADDSVTVAIDPKGDGMTVFVFTVNPRGEKKNTVVTALGRDPEDEKTKESLAAMKLDAVMAGWTPAWTGGVAAQAQPDEKKDSAQLPGWTAEIAIPFDSIPKQLAPPPQNNTRWKINIVATRRGASGTLESWGLAPTGTPSNLGPTQRWTDIQFIGQGKK